MKTSISLLLASTVLAASLGLPALAGGDDDHRRPEAARDAPSLGDRVAHLFRFLDEDDDDHHGRGGDHEDDDDDEDDDRGRSSAAATGSVTPPANGLFGSATPPRVQMN